MSALLADIAAIRDELQMLREKTSPTARKDMVDESIRERIMLLTPTQLWELQATPIYFRAALLDALGVYPQVIFNNIGRKRHTYADMLPHLYKMVFRTLRQESVMPRLVAYLDQRIELPPPLTLRQRLAMWWRS